VTRASETSVNFYQITQKIVPFKTVRVRSTQEVRPANGITTGYADIQCPNWLCWHTVRLHKRLCSILWFIIQQWIGKDLGGCGSCLIKVRFMHLPERDEGNQRETSAKEPSTSRIQIYSVTVSASIPVWSHGIRSGCHRSRENHAHVTNRGLAKPDRNCDVRISQAATTLTVKYGHASHGTRNQEWLCWRGPISNLLVAVVTLWNLRLATTRMVPEFFYIWGYHNGQHSSFWEMPPVQSGRRLPSCRRNVLPPSSGPK
jgi:hypothetical protein